MMIDIFKCEKKKKKKKKEDEAGDVGYKARLHLASLFF
jgi:hypothetical protein